MHKIIMTMVLLWSITGTSFAQAQKSKTDETFNLPEHFSKRKFVVDLGKGNTMQIDLDNMADIDRFLNMDSVLHIFLKDMAPFLDTLSDGLTAKRIDYIADSTLIRKVRVQQFNAKGSSYIVSRGEVSALKLEQDTINILGRVTFIADYTLRKPFRDTRYYRVSFYLNKLGDLPSLMDGRLNDKIRTIKKNVNSKWNFVSGGLVALQADPSVTARKPKGYVAGGDYIEVRISVDAANYKTYFVPSFSIGAGLIISTQGFFKREIDLSWDPHFFFARNADGQLKTYRNDFLTLTWGQGPIVDNEPRKESRLLFIASLGYLIRRKGEFLDNHTFRMGMGRLSIFEGKTKIEPMLYFNHFFRGVTPGIRWIQSF